jgi:hypothetical protein
MKMPKPRPYLKLWVHTSVVLALGFLPALSQAANPCLGVWSGTLGEIPVSMDISEDYGRYYYRANFSDLLLLPANTPATEWRELDSEGKQTGRLSLNCKPGKLEGNWVNADGKKTLPISATPAASYDAQRTARLRLKVQKTQTLGSRAIDTVAVDGVPMLNALRLRGDGPGIRQVNTLLQNELIAIVTDHMDCVSMGYSRERFSNNSWGEERDQRVVFWIGNVLSIRNNYSGYCGGAHPYHWQSSVTFDTAAGKAIPAKNWLAASYRKEIDLESALGRMIKSRLLKGKDFPDELPADEQSCAEAALHSVAKISAIEKGGVGFDFDFPYPASGCRKDYVIPWRKMRPYLSEEGKRFLNEVERN